MSRMNNRAPLSTNNNSNLHAPVYKSGRPCMRFQRGQCIYGDRCHFPHISNNSTRYEDFDREGRYHSRPCYFSFSGLACPHNQCFYIHRPQQQSDFTTSGKFYKTRLCYNWMSSRRCGYGIKCLYAHGEAELNVVSSGCSKQGGIALRDGGGGGTKRRNVDVVGGGGGQGLVLSQWSVEKIGRIYGDWLDTGAGGDHVQEGNETGI